MAPTLLEQSVVESITQVNLWKFTGWNHQIH